MNDELAWMWKEPGRSVISYATLKMEKVSKSVKIENAIQTQQWDPVFFKGTDRFLYELWKRRHKFRQNLPPAD